MRKELDSNNKTARPHGAVINMTTMNTTTTTTTTTHLPYYSGNFALNCPPTEGTWDGDTFTAADGSKWTFDPSDEDQHPSIDGTGYSYLIPMS